LEQQRCEHYKLLCEVWLLLLLLLQVPKACMYDTVGEFLQCPEVAYTQHYTTPFDEQCRNYW
jgi:hypothetical protein